MTERMNTAFTALLVPTYRNMLTALSAWLDKAQASSDADALMAARLAQDMYPLSTQIRFACVQVLEAIYRLQGKPLPEVAGALVAEGREAGDHPGTIAEGQRVIADTLAQVQALGGNALDMDADAALAHELPNGMIMDLTAQQYARDWALPQFYFHVMAAYAILRQQGIDLGKADYCAHMLPFIRQDAPAG